MSDVDPEVRLKVINDLVQKYPKIKKIIGFDASDTKVLGESEPKLAKAEKRFPIFLYPHIQRPPSFSMYKSDRGISEIKPSSLPGPAHYSVLSNPLHVSRRYSFSREDRHLSSKVPNTRTRSPGPVYTRYTTLFGENIH